MKTLASSAASAGTKILKPVAKSFKPTVNMVGKDIAKNTEEKSGELVMKSLDKKFGTKQKPIYQFQNRYQNQYQNNRYHDQNSNKNHQMTFLIV